MAKVKISYNIISGGDSIKSKKKIIVLVMCCIIFFVIGSCFVLLIQQYTLVESKHNELQVEQEVEQEAEQPDITFVQYLDLFNDFKDLSFSKYQLNTKFSFLTPGARAIEPNLSFDKRQFLTLNGEMEFGEDTSTERVLYFDSKQKRLAVSMIFTDTNIGNDFLGSDWLLFTEENLSNTTLISFHNILILITLESNEVIDLVEINELNSIIVEKLKSYSF